MPCSRTVGRATVTCWARTRPSSTAIDIPDSARAWRTCAASTARSVSRTTGRLPAARGASSAVAIRSGRSTSSVIRTTDNVRASKASEVASVTSARPTSGAIPTCSVILATVTSTVRPLGSATAKPASASVTPASEATSVTSARVDIWATLRTVNRAASASTTGRSSWTDCARKRTERSRKRRRSRRWGLPGRTRRSSTR
uniref:(northern house mosquito) hypothetical protein n=1 Tax=Culex pipiens TaxID=7175 RepID=A0A8D8FLK4_CULPI